MSAVLSVPTVAQRSGLFGIVAGAHLVLLLMLTLARVEAPVIDERTITVEILPMAAGGPAVQSKPAPPAVTPPSPRPVRERPKPVIQQPVKAPVPVVKAPEPQPEVTSSALPAAASIASSSSSSTSVSQPAAGGSAAGASASGSGPAAGPGASGDGSSQARFDADYLRNPAPPYPAISRRMREEGKVTLRVLVTPQGTAESVEVKTSSGSARLDEAALRTVRQWRFIPARRGDTAVQSWVLVPVIFKLEQ